jgi:hypothetical protein
VSCSKTKITRIKALIMVWFKLPKKKKEIADQCSMNKTKAGIDELPDSSGVYL